MQGSKSWTPPGGTLGRILEEVRMRLPSLEGGNPASLGNAGGGGYLVAGQDRPSFRDALRRHTVSVIAELKRKSPSSGELKADMDAATQARAFQRGGAAALSVLTEPSHFGGTLDDLVDAASAVQLPLLRKDFHIDPRQLHDAVRAGASAVLLIARAVPPRALADLVAAARTLGVEPLVEVRTESELRQAIDSGAGVIGVNSRDLETLRVDESVPARLIPQIPPGVVAVWESGIRSRPDVLRAAECGADAVLMGSALSRAGDPVALLKSLTDVPRRGRNG